MVYRIKGKKVPAVFLSKPRIINKRLLQVGTYFYDSDIDMINIALIALNTLNEKTARLRYLFYQVELCA